MPALHQLLDQYRSAAQTEREKGTYFEHLIKDYLSNEATYRDLYEHVWTYADWAREQGLDARDTGIDLVARTQGTGEYHAIQCKLYAQDYRVQKKDIDSFFTASGKKPFAHRIIVTTTNDWSEHAEDALQDQQPPVSKIDLQALEESQIDWTQYQPRKPVALKPQKQLREHQQAALRSVVAGLAQADRGKLIMACGTGKTYTSLKIAEQLAGKNKRVLFLVPSLALLSQTLTEWTQESATPLHSFAVCSDSEVGKKRGKGGNADDDRIQTTAHELRYPATTNAASLARAMQRRHDAQHMSVVYATYHSIDVIHRAQQEHGLPAFDLIVCDEAHRTTGATFEGEEESHFVRVHDNAYLRAAKRLYMTATPRIFGDTAKASAERDNVALYSMDDPAQYGRELFVITFSEAVKRKLLVDYKVVVLAVEESHVSRRIQDLLKDESNQLRIDDAAKIVGCWKALSKQGMTADLVGDSQPMQRAVAFCQVIEQKANARTHKVASRNIAAMFQSVVEAYQASAQSEEETAARLRCEAAHVDGGMNAGEKEERLAWLKADAPPDTCRILSNVRCLSEGVDVPALDAVLFLTPRNSQVDVVQSVGRVMRNAPGKQRGYIVLPVVIPAGVEPHEALNDNQTYKVVWQVLQALRSHDDRFDAMVNKLDLIGRDTHRMEVIAVTEKVQRKAAQLTRKQRELNRARHGQTIGVSENRPVQEQTELQFEIGEIERAIYAKLVQKVGNRHHWEDWANDIAKIANTHIDRIRGILDNPENTREIAAFQHFADELRDDLNGSISDGEVIEMLAQHLITKPVFDALFEKYSFARHNPMSQAMQSVLDVLHEHHLEKEASTLQGFYDSVKLRAEGIDSAAGKQKIVVELYDKFFRNAFPKMAERLGIVYTPVEVVDFIIHSVDHILRSEFGETLGSKNVHILDPFTGTGTFITRLLQSGLIGPQQLEHKYRHEIHANEIVLLAYYIAAINIEATYHDIMGGDYVPFQGICLTDTFQMYEKPDLVDALLVDNGTRRKRQRELDIRVIIGNPPYSAGQDSANDNNQNIAYPSLDERIRTTYAARSDMTSVKNLYDSYIRAIRWASDRIQDSGVIGFVTNAGWLDSNSADGLRRCLADEFSSLYVFHLRGNQRTSGELSRKEGGKIFGSGSRAPIAISLLIKNPQVNGRGQIFFRDIGDYLSREEKLQIISGYRSVSGIQNAQAWQEIQPDDHGDWLRQRDESFNNFIALGDKKSNEPQIFENYSLGLGTNRDAWCFNASMNAVSNNMGKMIRVYNTELEKSVKHVQEQTPFVPLTDPAQIAWSSSLVSKFERGIYGFFRHDALTPSLYRPFSKQWLYYDSMFNHRVGQMPHIFPETQSQNRTITIKQRIINDGQFALMTDCIMELQTDGGVQCFPLHIYETDEKIANQKSEIRNQKSEIRNQKSEIRNQKSEIIISQSAHSEEYSEEKSHDLPDIERDERIFRLDDGHPAGSTLDRRRPMLPDVSLRSGGINMSEAQGNLFAEENPNSQKTLTRRDGITDEGLAHFQSAYLGEIITKQDLFYYIYGILHSPDYRERYADNLSKELPRIPRVKTFADFQAFSQAGRELGNLHVHYENVPMYEGVTIDTGGKALTDAQYRVEKMKYGKRGKDKDLSTLYYNSHITVTGIPLQAYEYVVNGKPALDWVVERQAVRVDKASGIVNDANDWAIETMGNPKYPLELFLRVITVSLETVRIVQSLPKLDI